MPHIRLVFQLPLYLFAINALCVRSLVYGDLSTEQRYIMSQDLGPRVDGMKMTVASLSHHLLQYRANIWLLLCRWRSYSYGTRQVPSTNGNWSLNISWSRADLYDLIFLTCLILSNRITLNPYLCVGRTIVYVTIENVRQGIKDTR